MAIPTVWALRYFDMRGAIGLLVVLAVAMFVRTGRFSRKLSLWPLALWMGAAGVVLMNPEPGSGSRQTLIIVALVTWLAVWAVATTDARTVIASILDGVGLYLLINVIGYELGLRSPGSAARIGAVNESTGFTRIIYPFAIALDEPPTLASVFIVAVPFLLFSSKRLRVFRLVCLLAAIAVAWSAGSRTSLFISVALPTLAFLVPSTLHWVAPASALFASASALILPTIMRASQTTIEPVLKFLAPGRDTGRGDVASLSNRDKIWSRSIDFWGDHVHSPAQQLLGFGQSGHYRSGVSVSYADVLLGAAREPRRGTLHNALLQQLFDGGVIGWLLLTVALSWTAVRFSRRFIDWGPYAAAAALALSALAINSTVGVVLAPGFLLGGFMMATILVAAACQLPQKGQLLPAPQGSSAPSAALETTRLSTPTMNPTQR